MPIISESSYKKRPWYYFNAYLETLVPYFFTKTHWLDYERERIELDDGDFLDLDWLRKGSNKLIVVSHGFEGNSRDHFIEQSAAYLSNDYDILVWHYRGCSEEMNRLPRFYHHGDLPDLHAIITHAAGAGQYSKVVLLGFSMGGSLIVNYLGSSGVHSSVQAGIAFSAPFDLKAASQKLKAGFNKYLRDSFLKKCKSKIVRKAAQFPDKFDLQGLDKIADLEELLERYVLPLHGFGSIQEYYAKWSGYQYLQQVRRPLLIVNAKNDPMLSAECYPSEAAANNAWVHLETPRYGGHTGFTKKIDGKRWYIHRIEAFIQEAIG